MGKERERMGKKKKTKWKLEKHHFDILKTCIYAALLAYSNTGRNVTQK
jgi:hypothetical protein